MPTVLEAAHPQKFSGTRAVVFDAYGTLFDLASATATARDVLGDRLPALAELWRSKQLQYTWLRSLAGQHADFWKVTEDALDFALEGVGVANGELRERLMGAYERLGPYADARPALEQLKAAGLRLAILSNGAPRMLEAAARNAKLTELLEMIISVEEVAQYKPHPSVYRRAVDRLALWPGEVLFISANGWDAYGAKAFGLRVAWCNRSGQPAERLPAKPDAELRSLAELPALVAGK